MAICILDFCFITDIALSIQSYRIKLKPVSLSVNRHQITRRGFAQIFIKRHTAHVHLIFVDHDGPFQTAVV